jgi:hypothetical protein
MSDAIDKARTLLLVLHALPNTRASRRPSERLSRCPALRDKQFRASRIVNLPLIIPGWQSVLRRFRRTTALYVSCLRSFLESQSLCRSDQPASKLDSNMQVICLNLIGPGTGSSLYLPLLLQFEIALEYLSRSGEGMISY